MDHLALSLLIASQLKMLASVNSQHSLRFTVGFNTFRPQYNLLCSFSLFPENRLSLPTIATLLPVITPLSWENARYSQGLSNITNQNRHVKKSSHRFYLGLSSSNINQCPSGKGRGDWARVFYYYTNAALKPHHVHTI